MIKYLAIPLILVGCTAPVTDPPAHALEVEGGVEKMVCNSKSLTKLST